jgi:hypothetical protein
VEFKLTLDNGTGGTLSRTWDVQPLAENSKRPDKVIKRREGRSAGGKELRRPVWEKYKLLITFGAGALRNDTNWARFEDLLRARKIEIASIKSSKKIWTEYTLVIDEEVDFDRVEEIVLLATKQLVFVETNPRWYNTWNP